MHSELSPNYKPWIFRITILSFQIVQTSTFSSIPASWFFLDASSSAFFTFINSEFTSCKHQWCGHLCRRWFNQKKSRRQRCKVSWEAKLVPFLNYPGCFNKALISIIVFAMSFYTLSNSSSNNDKGHSLIGIVTTIWMMLKIKSSQKPLGDGTFQKFCEFLNFRSHINICENSRWVAICE